jgi:hypothetical protein
MRPRLFPSMPAKRFRIAFSFAGEKRAFVKQVADLLKARFGEAAILYDKYHEAEFAHANLAFTLPKLYKNEADLIVSVFCPDYDKKEWCGLEWRAIFSIIKEGGEKQIMLTHFQKVDGEGLFGLGGFIELDDKTAGEAATLILERLALNEGLPKNHYTGTVSMPPSTPASHTPTAAKPNAAAIQMWQKKKDFLEVQRALASGAAQKFEIQEHLDEATKMIAELSK